MGGTDLYEILPLPNRALPTTTVISISGKVVDENNQPIEAEIAWQELDTGKTLGKLYSKATTGEFFITLPVGKEYAFYAKKEGYFNISERIDLKSQKKYSIKATNFQLNSYQSTIKNKKEIVLNNIFFGSNSDKLNPSSFAELNRLVDVLLKNEEMKIEIQGHSDDVGNADNNMALSEKRAKSVQGYLLGKGVPSEKISAKGYGQTKPAFPNDSDEHRAKNRRVSFTASN